MGIKAVIILSILAMLFGVIILFIWIDQRRQQKRLRTIARQNRENRDRSRSDVDPLMAEVAGSGAYDDGILSAPRIVSQPTEQTQNATINPTPAYKTPTPPTARTVQVSSATTATTRTPRITPFPTPPQTQTPGYRAAQSAARLQAIKQKPLNPKFVPPSSVSITNEPETINTNTSETSEENQQSIQDTPSSYTEQVSDLTFDSNETTSTEDESQNNSQTAQTLPPYITFSIMAEKDKPFGGYDLLQAILGVGLRHGEHQIFHRYAVNDPTKILFSLASIAKPGTFLLEDMGVFSTPGLIFIFEIDRTPELLNSFELLLQTARQLNDELDGNLLDDNRDPLTTERIQALREQLREVTPVADIIDDQ